MLNKMNGALVHRAVCFMSKPVFITLFDSCDNNDKEQRKSTCDWTCGCINNQLYQEDDKKIKIGYSSELLKQILGYEVPKCVLGGDYSIIRVFLWIVCFSSTWRGFLMSDINGPTINPIVFSSTVSVDECPDEAAVYCSSHLPEKAPAPAQLLSLPEASFNSGPPYLLRLLLGTAMDLLLPRSRGHP